MDKAILGSVATTLGFGSGGFSAGYVGTSVVGYSKTIERAIIEDLGYKIIDSTVNHEDLLFQSIFNTYKTELESSGEIYFETNTTVSKAGDAVRAWCKRILPLKMNSNNERRANLAVKACAIGQNIRHKLIINGMVIAETDEDFKALWDTYKSDAGYKQIVLDDKTVGGGDSSSTNESDGKKKNKEWCEKTLKFYADSSKDTTAYAKAKDWCVRKTNTPSK